jgi:hypothetical protein
MTTSGVDYSSGRPGGAALAAAGMRFAARYLSHSPGKNLTPAEATDLAAHGVSCVVVWETTANRAGAGRAAGVADATEAAAQATACGQPAGRPIFFAVDWDANPSVVVAYFQGVASVLGVARTGVYGGYKVVKYLLDHKLATWAWQTVAWSQGHWDTRAVIRQYASTIRIGGVSCDHDTAMTGDYGQWTPGKAPITPQLEDDVSALDVLTYRNKDADAASVKAGHGHIPDVYGYLVQTNSLVKAQNATIATLAKAVGDLHPGVDTATLVAAVEKAIADAVVHVSVDVTGTQS